MQKTTPCLWFASEAEEAAQFYVSLVPDSHIVETFRSPTDTPSGPAGTVLTVDFTLAGQRYVALNGNPGQFTEAVSFQIHCVDQAETDRIWDAILNNGGQPMACGWIKDKFGLAWQIVPVRLLELIKDPDPARAMAAMESMMTMIKIDIAALEKAVDAV